MIIKTYDGKKILIYFFLIITVFIMILIYKNINVKLDCFKDDFVDVDTYKKTINQNVDFIRYQNNESIINNIIKNVTNIDIDNISTIIASAIPIIEYVNSQSIIIDESISEIQIANDILCEDYEEENKFIEKEIEENNENKKENLNDDKEEIVKNEFNIDYSRLDDISYLTSNFFTPYDGLSITSNELPIGELLKKDMKIDLYSKDPKILIMHTHSQENFKNSTPDKEEDTVVGVGQVLCDILKNDYGINTLHHTGVYDVVDGKLHRTGSYERIAPSAEEILKNNPSIEVVIDLHRDGVKDNVHLFTDIGGKDTAKIMFVNGISKKNVNGKLKSIDSLKNPYVNDNLAFSFQLYKRANELYNNFTRKIYVCPYRYNLHLSSKSLLIEVGANTNTKEEAKNAMEPFAKVLVSVLEGE